MRSVFWTVQDRFAFQIGERSGRGKEDALRACRRRISCAIQAAVGLQLAQLFRLPRGEWEDVGASLLRGG